MLQTVLHRLTPHATTSGHACVAPLVLLALMLPLLALDTAHGRIGNVSIFETVGDESALSAELEPVEMVGARNGRASGQVGCMVSGLPGCKTRVAGALNARIQWAGCVSGLSGGLQPDGHVGGHEGGKGPAAAWPSAADGR